jgi:3-hydroxyisobutyrate dehydrogenase-like beta-hydroxyacid dehydrogenase
MAANMVKAGHQVVGYDVVDACRTAHRRAGGVVAKSVAEVGRRASVIICSLPSPGALIDVATQLSSVKKSAGTILVETSTLPIGVKEEARTLLARARITMLDAPLSGTGSQAKVKDIVVYVSGPREAYKRVAPVLDGFARGHYYIGPFGDGSRMKFVANLLVAIHNVAAAEALVLAMKAGLDPALTLRVIGDGGGSSRMLQVRGPLMVRGDYSEATMKLDVWQKDMKAIADFAKEVGCPTPLFATTAPFYIAALAQGRGAEDTGAVCAVLEEMASYRRPRRSRQQAEGRRR